MSTAERIDYLAGRLVALKEQGDRKYAAFIAGCLRRHKQLQRRLQEVLDGNDGEACGIELANSAGQYVAVLPEPGQASKGRLVRFSPDGLSGHEVYGSPLEALLEALSNGYKKPCAGTMDQLAQTPQWHRAMRIADLIQQLGCGQITHQQFNEQLQGL